MLSLDGLDIDELVTALQDQEDFETCHLIDPHTGELGYWTRDGGIDGEHPIDLSDLDQIPITPLPSYVWYQDMEAFAEGISDERAGQRLARAIQGKGAFRRFKNELHDGYPELLPVWREFSDLRGRRRAVEWLVDNKLVDRDSADRFAAEHVDPVLP
jgi:hypothetical protein